MDRVKASRMTSNSIIVCETSGRWGAALRRELPSGMLLVETRSLHELWEQLEEFPAAIVALELTADKREPVLSALVRIGRLFPNALSLVFAERSLASWEDAVREAGAIHFIVSPRRLDEMGEIVRRRMMDVSHHAAVAAEGETISIEQRIVASLPWSGGE
jgi:hypothetical protein